MRYANPVRRLPGGEDRGLRSWVVSVAVVLLLTASLAISVDWLASAVGADSSMAVDSWWGARQGSPWSQAGSAKDQLKLKSIDLLITINGDELAAQYTLTASSKTALMATTLTAGKGNTGDDLVNNVLGSVSIAEFRYGLTGSHYTPVQLTFHGPKLTVGQGMTKVVVNSDPLRLFLHRQLITVMKPAGMAVGVPDQIQVHAPAVQVLAMSGAHLTGVAKDEANLQRGRALADITVSAGSNTGQDWLAGVREIGGITIPVMDGFFSRLSSLFFYAAFLWALVIIHFALPYSRIVEVSRNIFFTIVTALIAVAFLAFLVDLGTALIHAANPRGEAAAGPLALLVAGAALVWPVACFRTGRNRQFRRDRHNIAHPAWLTLALYCLVLGGYWVAVDRGMSINLFTNFHALTGTAVVVLLVWLLVRKLLGDAGVMRRLVSAGMLCVTLGATIIWPVLYFNSWTPGWDNVTHVNVLGKLIFFAVALLTILGLSMMIFRAVQALAIARLWQWLITGGIVILIGVVILHDTLTNPQLADPHAVGPTAVNLIDLFDSLPQLLDWLLLTLAIVVAMSLPTTSQARPLARRIVIPIGLLLLYWNGTWLYLPFTLIIGLIMLDRLVYPWRLAKATPYAQTNAQAINGSIAAWRQAEFASQQRHALTSSSNDVLMDLIKEGKSNYAECVESIAKVQNYLAKKRDRQQRNARKLEAQAFDLRGKIPSRRTAITGAVVGAILGIIPGLITILTTHPSPDDGGYQALDFFGGTAWNLEWAGLGWLIGYSLPLMRGRNGSEKALWLFIASLGATLPMQVIWNDTSDWVQTFIWSLEMLVFLMATAIYLCDLSILRGAGMRLSDWLTVQNWHFVVTWSTALLAAIGTAFVTFLSTAATDLSNRAVNGISGPSSTGTAQSPVNQPRSGSG